jgi:hypothetical protein
MTAMALTLVSVLVASPTISQGSDEPISASQSEGILSKQSKPKLAFEASVKAKEDDRGKILKNFLEAKGSPMAKDAEELVKIADKYEIDWKLLPAIAGVESHYGQLVPAGSYNPYGWNNGSAYFEGWADASEHVASGIRTRYAQTGEVTPYGIGPSYAANPLWAAHVNNYMHQISQI